MPGSNYNSNMVMNKYLRRRLLPTVALAAASIVGGVGAIEWTSTTSSSSDYVSTAVVGEITTVSPLYRVQLSMKIAAAAVAVVFVSSWSVLRIYNAAVHTGVTH